MVRKKLIKHIDQDQFEKLYSHCIRLYQYRTKLKHYKLALRVKKYMVSMLLGFESGMRLSEVCGLKYPRQDEYTIIPLDKSNVNKKARQIKIVDGKGGKDRIVPMPKRLTDNAIKLLPLGVSRKALQNFIKKIGYDVLNINLNFHMLRHGFGSHLAGKGVPLHEIQILMGHTRIDTTGVYLHANPAQAIDHAIDVF